MRYRTFLFWNALGGLCWGVAFTLAGYGAGRSYERVLSAAGTASASIVALAALAGAGFLVRHQMRGRRNGQNAPSQSHDSGGDDATLPIDDLGELPPARR
jgi:membrane protein DedA with SNARE-associated domain